MPRIVDLQLPREQYYLIRFTGMAMELYAVSLGADLSGQPVGFRTWVQREADPQASRVDDSGL